MRSLSSLGVALALMTLALMTPWQVDAHAAVIPSIIQDERVPRSSPPGNPLHTRSALRMMPPSNVGKDTGTVCAAIEGQIIRTPDSNTEGFRGPGHQLIGSYVDVPVHKLLRQTERQFLRHAGPEFQCTSADGPFCFMRAQDPAATNMASVDPSLLVQEVTHQAMFTQLLRRTTGSVLVLYHTRSSGSCPTCDAAHIELRDAASELRATGVEVPVLSVDCDSDTGAVLCAKQGVSKSDLPDVRLYFGSAAASVRFVSDAAALRLSGGVAGPADNLIHNVDGEDGGTLGWTSASLVSFVTDTRMHQLFQMVAQLAEGVGPAGATSTIIPGLNAINFAEDGTVVLNPDDKLLDSLRAMGLEVEVDVEGDKESENNEKEEHEDEEQWASGAAAEGGAGAAKAKAEAEAEAGAKHGGGVNAIEGLLSALIGSGTGTDARGKTAARSKVASATEGVMINDEKVQGVRVKTLLSMPTQISRNVEFRNLSKRSVQLHWVDFKGVEQKYSVLHHGDRQVISSFVNHVWLMRDATSHKAVKVAVVMNGVGTQRVDINLD